MRPILKTLTSIFKIMIFVKLPLITITALIISSSAFSQTNVSGVIESDETWTKEGSPYTVSQGLLVQNNATLTIEKGVKVFLKSSLNIYSNGTLIADSVHFSGGTVFIPSTIFMYVDANVKLDNITFEDGYIFSNGSLSLTNSNMVNSYVNLYGGTSIIQSNSFIEMIYPFKIVPGISFIDNNISNNSYSEGSSIYIEGRRNIVTDTSWPIVDNIETYIFQDWVGISPGATLNIDNNVNIELNDSFLTVNGNSNLISDSVSFKNGSIKINSDGFSKLKYNNIIDVKVSNNGLLEISNSTLESSTLTNNNNGTINASKNDFLTIGQAIENTSENIVQAENNWWGDASGPTHTSNPNGTGAQVSDNVDFDPWVTEPFDNNSPLITIKFSEKDYNQPFISTSATDRTRIYDQRKFWIPLTLELNKDTTLHNIEITGRLGDENLQIEFGALTEYIDNNRDGLIDQLPLENGFTPHLVFISRDAFTENIENTELEITINSINNIPTNIKLTDNVNMYFSLGDQNNPFEINSDAYDFENPTKLSLQEYKDYFSSRGIIGGLYATFYLDGFQNGRCYGMAGTTGLYFTDMLEKPFPETMPYDWSFSEFDVTNNINLIHLSQMYNDFDYDNINLSLEYQELKNGLKSHDPYLLGITAKLTSPNSPDELFSGHAILTTKVTEFNNKGISILESNDSNEPTGFTQSIYNLKSNTFDYRRTYGSGGYEGIFDEFLTINLSEIDERLLKFDQALETTNNWITRPGKKLISYASNFFSVQNKVQTNQSSNQIPSFMILDSQGNRFGFEGTEFANEIEGAEYVRYPVADESLDSLTFIFLPEGEQYNTFLKSNGISNNIRLEYYGSMEDSLQEVSVFENIEFSENTETKFDESTSTDELLIDSDGDGEFESKETNAVITTFENEGSRIPIKFTLSQNYPNPFNPTTQIQYGLPENSHVKLDVFNITGQKVTELVNEPKSAGFYTVKFDAKNLASGIYIYRLDLGGKILTKKMLLIK